MLRYSLQIIYIQKNSVLKHESIILVSKTFSEVSHILGRKIDQKYITMKAKFIIEVKNSS